MPYLLHCNALSFALPCSVFQHWHSSISFALQSSFLHSGILSFASCCGTLSLLELQCCVLCIAMLYLVDLIAMLCPFASWCSVFQQCGALLCIVALSLFALHHIVVLSLTDGIMMQCSLFCVTMLSLLVLQCSILCFAMLSVLASPCSVFHIAMLCVLHRNASYVSITDSFCIAAHSLFCITLQYSLLWMALCCNALFFSIMMVSLSHYNALSYSIMALSLLHHVALFYIAVLSLLHCIMVPVKTICYHYFLTMFDQLVWDWIL